MAESDAAWASPAFQEFYDRHKNYLWSKCSEVAENLGCQAWAEDVLNDTFERAYRTASEFKFPQCPTNEEDNVIKGWLGRIATNRLCDRWRKSRLEHTGEDEKWATLAETAAAPSTDASEQDRAATPADVEERRLLDEALESLSEREAHVLRVTSQYHRLGKKFQRLPNYVVDELAEALNTTPENLRKIRERAKKKVRQYIEERREKISP
jgi:RNA polymerase sigma factor (sigma-70 family)